MKDVLVAGLGGFAAWILIQFISYIGRRQRVESFLMVHFRILAENQRENRKWIVGYVDKALRTGVAVRGAPFYSREEFQALTAIQADAVYLLDSSDLSKVVYFTQLLAEIDILFEGFCKMLREYQTLEVPLPERDVDSLIKRSRRIINHIDILPETLRDFSDLPTAATIKARQGADTLIPDRSATEAGEVQNANP